MCLFDTSVLRNKLYSTTTISLIPRQKRGVARGCSGQPMPLAWFGATYDSTVWTTLQQGCSSHEWL